MAFWGSSRSDIRPRDVCSAVAMQIKSLVSRLQGYETTSSEDCMGYFLRIQEITEIRVLKRIIGLYLN